MDLSELGASLAGTVIGPEDPDYDSARRGFNALIDRRPAVIARCAEAGDIATAFDFARTHGLDVAVRGGGHNPAGHCVVEGGLVIDLTQMCRVEVDEGARIARSDGGATWLDFDTATQESGLVTPGGVVGSTGVAGLTFGGGIGHLTAQYGLTCDGLVAAELVTPDGTTVRAGEDGDPELLWGLRGGGGNFGVATWLQFRLYELDRVIGGTLRYSGDGVHDALRGLRDLAAGASPELSCQASLGVDADLTPVLEVTPCYTGTNGDPDELRVLRALPGLVADSVQAQTFIDQQNIFDSAYGENRHYWKGHFVRELPEELLDELLARVASLGRPPGGILIESLHGAPKGAGADSAALGFRNAAFNVSVMATWEDPAQDEEEIRWARETAAALEPWSFSGGGYINYMQEDEPLGRRRAIFGAEAFDRLQSLKTRYDPDNVLRRNQNVPPG
jgi:FAD/FMN-containing dehydrogenase